MSARAFPVHCPYCGDENLWPHEGPDGGWECRACLRAFSLRMLGMIRPAGASGTTETTGREDR